MALNNYLKQVQILINDLSETNYNRTDLVSYINEGRQQIAAAGQCVRAMPFVGTVVNLLLNTNGSGGTPGYGYALTFTGTCTTSAIGTYDVTSSGAVTNIVLTSGGTGYTAAPTLGFGGAGFSGVGAVAPTGLAQLSTGIFTITNQEVYQFSSIDFSNQPGISGIIAVRGVSILWNTFRFTATRYGFAKYQAKVRTYVDTFTDVPRFCAQFGQGETGSIYFYPVPNEAYVVEMDCVCDVTPLVDDTTVEAIPAPWTVSVQYYAAYKAFQSAQNYDAADRMYAEFEKFMRRARTMTNPGVTTNWYGRA